MLIEQLCSFCFSDDFAMCVRYGFRSKPELVLFAKPWVGDHEVSLSPLTEWIEKKLAIEFQV